MKEHKTKELLSDNIGKQCYKKRKCKRGGQGGPNETRQPKKFRSGLKINTINGVIKHPIINGFAYTFEEDDSYVACGTCIVINNTDDVNFKI